MADNVTANAGSGGATFATASGSWSGDTANFPGCFLAIASGSEGAWTFTAYVGGAGVVTAGTQRVTLASDDAAVTALQIMDDWDESDRAKVNLIVGQAGIAGGTGVDGATVPRVTLATNVALPAGTNAIGKLAANSGVDIGDTDVTSVIPGTGATNLGKAIDTALGVTDTGVLALTVRDDSLATLTEVDGDVSALRVDSTGRLWCNVSNTVTVASHAVTNAGTFAVQVDGSALTSLQLIDDTVFTDDAGFTPGTSKLLVVGGQADEASTDSVDEGDAGALRMTLDRRLYTVPSAHTQGGCSIFRTLDLDETEEDVKTAAGQVYGIFALNTTNALLYLKFYNATAANVTVGTTTPVMTFPVPGNNDTDGAGFYIPIAVGLVFDTAICVAATTGVADNDTGAPGANALIVQVFYK